MGKKRVGVLYGGRSVEHDISLLSAKNIYQNIDRDKFDVTLLGIDKLGRWFLMDSIDQPIGAGKPLQLVLDAAHPSLSYQNTKVELDIVFPVLHGTDGEDGSIQGLFQTVSLPYVGSGVLGSAAAMDKLLSKRVMQSAGLPVAQFLDYSIEEIDEISFKKVSEYLGLPIIIKPVNLGSSVGVSKVSNEAEFKAALADAFKYDNAILIEEFIEAREVECGILGNINPLASVAGEVILSNKYSFYSFTAKYEDPDSAEITIPAELPDEVHTNIKKLSLEAYKLLNCKDLSRIDLFVRENGEVLINEINTIPGFTNISMYPSLMRHEGIAYKELITRLLEMALARFQANTRISTDYESQL